MAQAEQFVAPHGDTIPKLVVGIGASAGGLEALESLFESLPTDADFAYVVVTHLSPDFKSLLDELIGRRTDMPVHLVEDGVHLEPRKVYVIPPRKEMMVAGDRLYLRDRQAKEASPIPINTFLRSLAREWGRRAAGVILSGSGSDGAHGIQELKAAGGLTLVQAPDTARFPSMPTAAIETGDVDYVVNPDRVGSVLIGYAQGIPRSEQAPSEQDEGETHAVERIIKSIYGLADIDFSGYKTTTLNRRIRRRMAAVGVDSLVAYAEMIQGSPGEVKHLYDDLLIGVTKFFRDTDAFAALRTMVLPPIVEGNSATGVPIRVWVPGCATGQEAYSVAISIHEVARELGRSVNVQVFATDLQRTFLERAGRGSYTAEEMDGVDPDILTRYFVRESSGGFTVSPMVRKWVVFAPHDLLRDPPFTKVDLVCCRNVLIYFSSEVQKRLIAIFHFSLTSDGALFLGPSEALGELERDFKVVDKRWKLFRKAHDRPLYIPPAAPMAGRDLPSQAAGTAHRYLAKRKEVALLPAYNALLRQYAPPSALITADRELLHTFGEGRRHLHPPEGVASYDVANMVDGALRTPLITGIERAIRDEKEVVFPHLKLREDGIADNEIRLHVRPLKDDRNDRVDHLLIVFEEVDQLGAGAYTGVIEISGDQLAQDRIQDLESELARTRETLQATIEEVETSNEELQSSNEELMAANEELQSTNEELNSVNEELYSVNSEYQRQNEELTNLHADMESLLQTTNIGMIFVDERLSVRRFTDSAARLFNAITTDLGRPIGHITHRLGDFDVENFIGRAMTSRKPLEQEILADDGNWWLLRCAAHNSATGEAQGGVLTMFDIDRVKRMEQRAAAGERRYQIIAELAGAMYLSLNIRGAIADDIRLPEWEAYTGQTADEYRGRGWWKAVEANTPYDRVEAWMSAEPETTFVQRLWHEPTQSYRHNRIAARRLTSNDNSLVGWSIAVVDIEEAIKAKELVEVAERRLHTVMAVTPSLLSYLNGDLVYEYCNPAHQQFWENPDQETVGRRIDAVLPEEILTQVQPFMDNALRGLSSDFLVSLTGPDGKPMTLQMVAQSHLDDSGKVLGIATSAHDVTGLRPMSDVRAWTDLVVAQAADLSGVIVVLFDRATLRVVYANATACARFGFSLTELLSMRVGQLFPEISDAQWSSISTSKSPLNGSGSIETFAVRRNGESVDCEIDVNKLPSPKGEIGVVTARDVTGRIEMARTLRQRTAQLAASNRDLEQFASVASHDLRTPLRHIEYFVSSVLEDYGQGLQPDLRNQLEAIGTSANRLKRMVGSLLEYSRLSTVSNDFGRVSLAIVFAEARANLEGDVRATGAVFELPETPPAVRGDHSLLVLLFQNLFSNAIKYRSESKPRIVVSVEPGVNDVFIGVADNGIGIPEEFVEKVFEIFSRLGGNTNTDGTGIGLALCRRIVEIHEGTIRVDTSVSNGCRIVLQLRPG